MIFSFSVNLSACSASCASITITSGVSWSKNKKLFFFWDIERKHWMGPMIRIELKKFEFTRFYDVNYNAPWWENVKARANYGYEFLIRVTFIWEFDEDKPFVWLCHFCVGIDLGKNGCLLHSSPEMICVGAANQTERLTVESRRKKWHKRFQRN